MKSNKKYIQKKINVPLIFWFGTNPGHALPPAGCVLPPTGFVLPPTGCVLPPAGCALPHDIV
jgi:hypothetical protein